jgi:hypothetical protein
MARLRPLRGGRVLLGSRGHTRLCRGHDWIHRVRGARPPSSERRARRDARRRPFSRGGGEGGARNVTDLRPTAALGGRANGKQDHVTGGVAEGPRVRRWNAPARGRMLRGAA